MAEATGIAGRQVNYTGEDIQILLRANLLAAEQLQSIVLNRLLLEAEAKVIKLEKDADPAKKKA